MDCCVWNFVADLLHMSKYFEIIIKGEYNVASNKFNMMPHVIRFYSIRSQDLTKGHVPSDMNVLDTWKAI